ncbi:hypothetical protein H6F89_23815 [Cyanobacteria bacterium FACHB-63]|nr:hypothetical protein [Cyanobacteria bacterium FACHB-63]
MATNTQPALTNAAPILPDASSLDRPQAESVSSYLQYLPTIFQAQPFVGRFLLAFEQILSGSSTVEASSPGLEQYIEHLHTYFQPLPPSTTGVTSSVPGIFNQTPDAFLPWLASWVALSLREGWEPQTKRAFIQAIVPLYKLRGTKAGLEKILELYLDSAGLPKKVEIFDSSDLPPHFFQVQLVMATPDPIRFWQQVRIAKTIIDQEKPAHTFYALKILTPTMQLSGRVFPLKLTATCQITAQLRSTTNAKLALRIQSTQTDPENPLGASRLIVAEQIGTALLNVNCTVTSDQAMHDRWSVTITNLSRMTASGTLTITIAYPDGTASEQFEFPLNPILASGLFLTTRAKGGNTFLGTEDRET